MPLRKQRLFNEMKEQILALVLLVSTFVLPASMAGRPVSQSERKLLSPIPENREVILAEHHLDLRTRNKNPYTNKVFADNILLALDFFPDSFTLAPGEVFAFHPNVLPEFANLPVKTGWTKYTAAEGYKTVGGLPGNGVCHLASLMNWVASEAGLEVIAKVNHNFFPVPGIPKEYGTSIRYMPNGRLNSQNQNLYIRNNFDFPVKFVFSADSKEVGLKIIK